MRRIVAATEENKEEILKLYKIQLGREFVHGMILIRE